MKLLQIFSLFTTMQWKLMHSFCKFISSFLVIVIPQKFKAKNYIFGGEEKTMYYLDPS